MLHKKLKYSVIVFVMSNIKSESDGFVTEFYFSKYDARPLSINLIILDFSFENFVWNINIVRWAHLKLIIFYLHKNDKEFFFNSLHNSFSKTLRLRHTWSKVNNVVKFRALFYKFGWSELSAIISDYSIWHPTHLWSASRNLGEAKIRSR